jgi:hypothetical protein
MEVCDFCTHPVPEGKGWVLPANSFQLQFPPWGSAGDWLACGPCATLIHGDDWAGLADRVMKHYLAPQVDNDPWAVPALRVSLAYCYSELRKNITGPIRSR